MAMQESYEQLAVEARNICKSYENGSPILSNLSMKVKRGSIYGLLGSSGCGKTTLLSCVVGLKKWDSGEISLFGKVVNGTPGKRVGFMPQDVALHTGLSVQEAIEYYGRLFGMPKIESKKQLRWLSNFLQLPSKFQLIKDLSGGQQRRVSLAITLFHRPELLILDEPTIGLDPLLRIDIWKHFRNLVEAFKVTVIVTTHYIEETLSSDTVGVLRNGRLLTENSPQSLLQQYGCEHLEQVILKLCHSDEHNISNRNPNENDERDNVTMTCVIPRNANGSIIKNEPKHCYDEEDKENVESTVIDRITALSIVIWRSYARHEVRLSANLNEFIMELLKMFYLIYEIEFITMILLLPTLVLILGLAVLGSTPQNLKMGVVNNEQLDEDFCFRKSGNFSHRTDLLPKNGQCSFKQLSCSLISELSNSGIMSLISIKSDEMAKHKITLGQLMGYFSFPSNYSQHVADLVIANKFAENKTLEGSQVHLTMDMSNYITSSFVIRDTYDSYERFSRKLVLDCGLNPLEFQIPTMYRKPVFGNTGSGLNEYFLPMLLQSIGFVFPMLMTSLVLINDRKLGTLDRARVAGVQFKEVMISLTITQGSVIITQTAISLAVISLIYGIRVAGSYPLFFILCTLGGFCGQALGLLGGISFQEEVEAYLIAIFLTIVLYVLEGFYWPIDGITYAIRRILYLLPTTLLIDGIRSVIFRGVGLLSNFVWPGVVITLCWTISFWLVSMIIFRWKQRRL